MKIEIKKIIEIDSEIFDEPALVFIQGLNSDGDRASFTGQAVDVMDGGCLIYVPCIPVKSLCETRSMKP